MKYTSKSERLFKYQKAKEKLVEFNTDKEDYPFFIQDSALLSYSATYILSRYSECIIEDEIEEKA